jgi:ethanolamine ammonia-lyase small subunit
MKPPLPNSQSLTTARLSLGNSAAAISTHDQLRFQLDHALARDAVHAALDVPLLERRIQARGLTTLLLRSAARDRKEYLRRPDLGCTLSPASIAALQSPNFTSNAVISTEAQRSGETPVFRAAPAINPEAPILFILADGLSALALERHALPLLDATLPLITNHSSLITVATNARVALGDHIGQLLSAQLTVLFIGERPGLSSPDSLGVYLTWQPRLGRTDAERNCISNIRTEGLSYAEAAHRIAHYIAEARRLQTTGIALKDPVVRAILGP